MGLFAAGEVVVLPFPYSDLTGQKVRPAVLIAPALRDDWIACQITTNPYADDRAIRLVTASFSFGGLRQVSYARPSKVFTANESIMTATLGRLTDPTLTAVQNSVIALVRGH